MDERVRRFLEDRLGLGLAALPKEGVGVWASSRRADARWNRFRAFRVDNATLVTCLPSLFDVVAPVVRSMTTWELFSPLGEAEIRRVLGPEVGKDLFHGLQYALSDRSCFRPATTSHAPRRQAKADIPPSQRELRMSQRQRPVGNDFMWAFACYQDDENVSATDLAEFGRQCVSIAIIIWEPGHDIATYGVGTHQDYQGRGYALANMTAATDYILQQGGVALYEAAVTNIPSLRIPRRLGFSCAWQEMRA